VSWDQGLPQVIELLLDENKGRFNQAGNTPPLIRQLREALGPTGDTEWGERILNGMTPEFDNINETTKQLLQQLQWPEDQTELDHGLNVADFCSGWT
jgi:hypothetical protein